MDTEHINIKVVNFDSNVSVIRLSNLPLHETVENELSYIMNMNPDVIIHRESHRSFKKKDGSDYSWSEAYSKNFPGFVVVGKALKGDQSIQSMGITVLVRDNFVKKIHSEIHDISSKPDESNADELRTFKKFTENKIIVLFINDKPVAIFYHAYLARPYETLWIWQKEVNVIEALIQKYKQSYGYIIDIFADANIIHSEQNIRWIHLQKEYSYKYAYGTDKSKHLSFCGLRNSDWVPRIDVEKEPVYYGFAGEKTDDNGKQMVVPISAIDGALSNTPFFVIAPSINENGILTPVAINITDIDDKSAILFKEAFFSVADENEKLRNNGKDRACGFDHISFMVNYTL